MLCNVFVFLSLFLSLCVMWISFSLLVEAKYFNVYYSYSTATTVLIIIVIAHTTTVSDLNVFISLLSAVTFCDCLLCQLICVCVCTVHTKGTSVVSEHRGINESLISDWMALIWNMNNSSRHETLVCMCVYFERETKLQYKRFWLW